MSRSVTSEFVDLVWLANGVFYCPACNNARAVEVAVTLKDNVVELHYYLFDEENYEVSNEVASYSQEIEETSGFGQEYRESAIEYGTVKDNGGEADITR